jgi:biofilm protein TabA
MKSRYIQSFVVAAALSSLLGCGTARKHSDTVSEGQRAAQWFQKKQWGRGLALNVHPSVNTQAFFEQYHRNPALWEKAFAYLRDTDLEHIKPGKYPIQGDTLTAAVTEGPAKELDKAAWEAHRRYVDLQYVIRGREKMAVAPIDSAELVKPYDEKKDVANYKAEGTYYTAGPGTYFLFFPADVHRPSIRAEGYDTVKKIVLKIRVAD